MIKFLAQRGYFQGERGAAMRNRAAGSHADKSVQLADVAALHRFGKLQCERPPDDCVVVSGGVAAESGVGGVEVGDGLVEYQAGVRRLGKRR